MTNNSNKKLIAPSILSADFGRLAEEIKDVERAGADWIHVDVMDGHFVPNLTIGPCVVDSIRKVTKLPLDVHLMIEEPAKYIREFRKAGSDWITIHVEACRDVRETIRLIKDSGAKAGISVRPKTPVSAIEPYLDLIDLVLVMTVEPGFGGQEFMEEMLQKVEIIRKRFPNHISVDGGINVETVRRAAQAGVNVFVAGSAIFKEKDRKAIMARLREAIS
ncbi:MAG: ribulose-phosphate 3-epimerase [Omnitrophica bacterium RIFCSPLOWO2_12_FULL_44_17]|uniref:Ribulose-phosphate 3-epimerase n=1 Tax=Candidatus Danuiimicrobium aquiferis TaxID=1801832 RepID=A0A1G1KR96_9BACT|nr:MAG: ribulose-phosphate 3-epimerase [Omnitrophica bacterium RIFCSPHIGHO2_02_FULL_45_28]OGW89510.1 MAG: ribulose-phosphate 3-epimerase [Omnitrophica bacterium RIFCSPHIGHO2_12_FULL_44_12]OGW95418.1 MAG: ribulose-phosphate 3-epimerase [Omnitrophica bacterium RIFCSPLOWO2_12_FULL_44_17]OGX03300.1 MAG: ribulose-phosphate 3-epimerase [Omnitrophica bacterium RIFCSPLOWO2_02_FULL_44_11]